MEPPSNRWSSSRRPGWCSTIPRAGRTTPAARVRDWLIVSGAYSATRSNTNAALLARAGVKVALMETDTHNSRNLRQQAGNAVSYGMAWDQALRAVTLSPAEMFGVADRYGSLEPGKVANVVVWSGDPFEFTTGVEHVA